MSAPVAVLEPNRWRVCAGIRNCAGADFGLARFGGAAVGIGRRRPAGGLNGADAQGGAAASAGPRKAA